MKKFYTTQTCGKLIAFGLFAYLFFLNSFVVTAQISLTTLGTAYMQDFNTLASTGTANTTVPADWAFSESGSGANTTYEAGTGSNNAGNTYSFGAASNTERAFGGLQSGSVVPTIGASFTNNTGSTVTSLVISYTGEQWRIGNGNSGAARDDRMDFQYSTDATDLTTGAWTDVNSLDFTNPIKTQVAVAGALDGNAAANRTAISFTITGLSIANGATFWIRWNSFDASGADDGLAVDDFSLTPQGATCTDGFQNGDEAGVDCGGTNCPACPPATTSTTIISSLNPSFTGDNVTFTATVTSGGNPVTTGTVDFRRGMTTLAAGVALNGSGQASFSISTLTEGSHTITATYNGATGFNTSNGSIVQVVNNRTVVNGNSFCNTGSITLNDGNTGGEIGTPATPYPSNIFVSGLSGTITSMTVDIKGLNHGKASDVDLLLVAPTGQTFLLMTGVGQFGSFSNANLTLNDAGASALPQIAGISSGTYRPASYEADARNIFPAPAPAGPYNQPDREGTATFASVFNGLNPNGTWELYATDDTTVTTGSIANGWCLNISTIPPCDITSIVLSDQQGCDDNGTMDQTDDFYTADVTVTFSNPPAMGLLELEQDGAVLDVVNIPVGSLVGNTHTFQDVRLKANGMVNAVEAQFSADQMNCVRTAPAPAVNSCSPICAISSIIFSDQQPCDDNGTMDQTDDFYTADVTVTFSNPPAMGLLELEQDGAVLDVVNIPVGSLVGNTHTFQDVRLKANGMANAVEAQFSADQMNCVRTAPAPAVNSCACTPPAISDEPDAITACAGSATTFTVVASGSGTLSFQWQEDGNDLTNTGVYSNVNTATLNISDVTDLNGKKYKVIITNDNGTPDNTSDDCSTTSEEGTLTVNLGVMVEAGIISTAICLTKPLDLTQIGASITRGGAAFTGTWSILESDSDGQFLPSNVFGTATTFKPGKADGKRGYVTLVLTSDDPDGDGPCVAKSDTVRITVLNVDCGQFPWNGN